MIRLLSALTLVFSLVTTTALGAGCIIDGSVDDFEIKLPDKSFHFDTGQVAPPEVIPMATACVPAPTDSCAAISPDLFCRADGDCEVVDPTHLPEIPCTQNAECAILGDAFECNTGLGSCMAVVSFELSNPVHLASEVPELETLGNSNFTSVRFQYIRMHVQSNTFSLPTPQVNFYVAPETVATLLVPGTDTLDPEVEQVGAVPSIPSAVSGQTVDVDLTPGGEAALTQYCRYPNDTFKLFVYAQMNFQAGDPIPQGAMTLVIDAAAIVSLN